jgi:hypothetical protein
VQEEEQRGAAQEVDEDEGRERSERVDVVGARQATGPLERRARADATVDHRRHGEPGEGEPGQGGQDEEPDQEPHGQEDDGPDAECGQVDAPWRSPPEDEHAGFDVGQREERRAQREERRLGYLVAADRELVEGGDGEPERKTSPEAPLVEANRVGDELADRSVSRRDLGLSHALDRTRAG